MSTVPLYDALADRLVADMPAEVNRLGMSEAGFLCHVYACIAVVMEKEGIVSNEDFNKLTPEEFEELAKKVARAMANETLIAASKLVDAVMS